MEAYLAATNCTELCTHLIADQSQLTMHCGKQLKGYWYGRISAANATKKHNGICNACKRAVAQQSKEAHE